MFHAAVGNQQLGTSRNRDLLDVQGSAVEEHCHIAFATGDDILIHDAATNARVAILGAAAQSCDFSFRQRRTIDPE